MQVNSVQQSTSFGYFRPAGTTALVRAFEKLPPAQWLDLKNVRINAEEALKLTKYAHVHEYVNEDGKIFYKIMKCISKLVFDNGEARTDMKYEEEVSNENLPAIVQKALGYEKELAELAGIKHDQLKVINGSR